MLKKLLKRKTATKASSSTQLTISSSQLPVTAADSAGLDYSSQRELLAGADVKARLLLAQSQDTMPEILYYLAGDQEAEVRQAVAARIGESA